MQGYSTSVIEQLEGGELAGIHRRGNDTQRGTQPDMKHHSNETEKKRKVVCATSQHSRSLIPINTPCM